MSRINARAAVMQMVFECLEGGNGGEDTLQMVYNELRNDDGLKVNSNEPDHDDRLYIERVLHGVIEQLDELDSRISQASIDWRIDRMPMVDLTVLRLATWQILYQDDVPGNVAIAEALELVDRYSDPEDKRFVNGVLGRILRDFEGR